MTRTETHCIANDIDVIELHIKVLRQMRVAISPGRPVSMLPGSHSIDALAAFGAAEKLDAAIAAYRDAIDMLRDQHQAAEITETLAAMRRQTGDARADTRQHLADSIGAYRAGVGTKRRRVVPVASGIGRRFA